QYHYQLDRQRASGTALVSLCGDQGGAIDTLTMALAMELGPRNIRVNAVAQGHTETEGTHRIGLVGSAHAQQMVAATPLGGRFGRPEDSAPVVVFLASDEAAWLTGERISASGGARESRAMCFGRVRGNGRLVMGSPQVPSGDERRPRATAQPHVGCAQRMVVETGDDETDAGDLRHCATLAMRNSRVPTKG